MAKELISPSKDCHCVT